MKTFKECKEEIAKKYGYDLFTLPMQHIEEAAELYAKERIEEQIRRKDQVLITLGEQYVELERLKKQNAEYEQELMEYKKAMHRKFYNIGAPLNDNNLKFNKEQLKWIYDVYQSSQEL